MKETSCLLYRSLHSLLFPVSPIGIQNWYTRKLCNIEIILTFSY